MALRQTHNSEPLYELLLFLLELELTSDQCEILTHNYCKSLHHYHVTISEIIQCKNLFLMMSFLQLESGINLLISLQECERISQNVDL